LRIEEFKLERWQSTYENTVRYNLAESGVHPFTVKELVGSDLENLASTRLGYGHTNGTPELRELISRIYKGQTDRNILVTNGSSEANFVSIWHLVEQGDKIAVMLPNYMQIWGLAQVLGARVKTFKLQEKKGWALDTEKLKTIIDRGTKLIVICNPNNPTGTVLSDSDMKAIRDLAHERRAWILSDEVYQGAEIDGIVTSSFLDIYDRALVTSGLSKAYGLPGLRIGWIAGPESLISGLWSKRDYTSIAPSVVSDMLACVALKKRDQILDRTRKLLRTNLPIIKEWADLSGFFNFVKPKAGAITFMRYDSKTKSVELANKLREKKNVLVAPGKHFGVEGYLRIGYGAEPDYLKAGLSLIDEYIQESHVG
jgi:aspartate/methionine/tyrosine aminotransferase